MLFQNHPMPMWVYDQNTLAFLQVNDAAVKKYGYSPDEFRSLTIKDIRPAEDVDALVANLKKNRGNLEFSGTWRHKLKDGQIINVEITSHTLEFKGHPGVLVVAQDTTVRNRAEDALQHSKALLDQIINTAMDAVITLDKNQRIIIFNAAAEKIFGCKAAEAIGGKVERFISKGAREVHEKNIQNFAKSGIANRQMSKLDYLFAIDINGREFPIDASISQIEIQGEKFYTIILRDITERKQAEEAIFESEERFKNAFQHSAIGMALVSLDGKWLSVNSKLCSIIGYSEGELLNKTFQDITHPDDLNSDLNHLNQVLAGEIESYTMEKRYFHKEGKIVWVLLAVALAKNYAGAPLYFISQVEDITKRKQAETSLNASEARYQSLFKDLPIALWEEDFSAVKQKLDGLREEGVTDFREYFTRHPQEVIECAALVKVLDVNDAAIKMSKAKSKEELIYSFFDLIKDEPIQQFQNELINVAEGKTKFGWEGTIKTLDGSLTHVDLAWYAISTTEKPLSRVVVSILDITERKLAEQELHNSEQLFRELVNNIEEVFWITEPVSKTDMYVSPAYKKVWGRSLKNVEDFVKSIEPEDQSTVVTALEKQRRGEKTEIEYCIKHTDDSVHWVWDRAFPIFNASGELMRVAGIATDITERKRAEEALYKSEERYRALFEDMPVAIWEEDFSDVKKHLDSLKELGITDLRTYFESNPDALFECAAMIRVSDINQAALKMYHAESKEALVESFSPGLSEIELEYLISDLIAIMEGKTSNNWEGSDETLTGEPIEISLSWTVAPGYEVDFSKVIITTIDITERKQAEKLLRISEEKYRLIIENAGEALYVVQNGLIVFVNPMFEKIAEFSASELIGKPIMEFIPAQEGRMAAIKSHLRLLRGKIANTRQEIKVRLRSGKERWIDANEVRTTWDGELAALTFATDITDRKHREREQEVLASVTYALNQGVDLDVLLQNLLDATLRAIPPAEKGAILLLDAEDNLRIRALSGYLDPRVRTTIFPSTSGYSARAVRESQPLIIADAHADTPTHYNDEIEEMQAIQSALVVPFMVKGRAIGAISLDNASRKGAFGENDLIILSTFASSAALVIQNTYLFEESRQRIAELELLYESGLAISQLLNPKEIGQKIIDLLEQKMNWHHTAIRLYNAKNETLELLAFQQSDIKNDTERLAVEMRFKTMVSRSGQGVSGWVVQHGETVRTGNLMNDDRYAETFEGLHSGLYVPIKIGERVIGVISIESEKDNAFSKSDEQLTTVLATQAASIFENARLYEDTIQRTAELEHRVTERTAQIEATKRRLELATHAGQIGVWEYNPRENIVIWDERMYMIHHVPNGEFDGTYQAWAKLIHPDDIEKSQINVQLAITKNLLLSNEHRILWPDGSIHHIATNAVTVFTNDGVPDRIIGINMDITERKQIEQSLREAVDYARLLFDAVPDPVSVTEADGLIVDVNKVFEEQHGLVRDEIRGRHISELGIYQEIELDKREKYLSEVLQGQMAKPIELEFYVPGDRIHTLEFHSYLLKVNGRQLILNTTHDITEYKKAEEIQRLAKSEMERALRIKNEFLANMSHELRTPLNSILGISESLEEQISGTLNEKQFKYIGIIRESGHHLLDLINDILDLSKIEAGRMELDIHHIAIENLCQSSLRMVKELAQKKSLNVSYKINGEIKIVLGDERRLKQSLVNLLSNAVKFTPPESKIGLEVNAHPETDEITFTVWDQGIGIAQQDIQYLFKPFVQLDAGLAREYQGTGLGLALVAQMIQLHGGHISVESEVGKGSRFIITLPWLPNEQAPKVKVTAELSFPSPTSNKKRNGKILIVEDTDVVSTLTSDYLRYKGYEVFIARNGMEGISIAREEKPDIILMDIMMPVMDGLEATRRIRADGTLQNIIIIALTALAMSGDRERCLAAGMNDYMSKPIQMQELVKTIENHLTAKQEK